MNDFLSTLFHPKEQWSMSAINNEPGMSLPEYHPDEPQMSVVDWLALTPIEEPATPDVVEEPEFAATDPYIPTPTRSSADMSMPKLQNAFNAFIDGNNNTLTTAQKELFTGAIFKTVAAASDFFSRATGIAMGAPGMIRKKGNIIAQGYQNQMDALDNQVLYIKHQLSDRFNKTVETNIMNMAARGLRVNAGNVLELSKESASEITEDMRTVESNARLKQIAFTAGKKQAKESASYASKQLWTGLAQSAIKLGLMWETGGGTGESWGNLYSGWKSAKKFEEATKTQEFNKLY